MKIIFYKESQALFSHLSDTNIKKPISDSMPTVFIDRTLDLGMILLGPDCWHT
jgi:hypothetical protein